MHEIYIFSMPIWHQILNAKEKKRATESVDFELSYKMALPLAIGLSSVYLRSAVDHIEITYKS